jgi:hypothetical protein
MTNALERALENLLERDRQGLEAASAEIREKGSWWAATELSRLRRQDLEATASEVREKGTWWAATEIARLRRRKSAGS